MATTPTNSDDFFDSRDIIARIAELEAENEDEAFEEGSDEWNEYASLNSLAGQAEDYVSDWKYGATFYREDYFPTYAKEYAEEVNGIDSSRWPFDAIDWDDAADKLKVDYHEYDFDGTTYWAR